MIAHDASATQEIKMINRIELLKLLNVGLEVSAYRFTRQAALAWMAVYPGDLEINLKYVETLWKEDRIAQAKQVLQKILDKDPIYIDALQIGKEIFSEEDLFSKIKITGLLQALGEKPSTSISLPNWGTKLLLARNAMENHQYDSVKLLLKDVLADSTHPELADILHLQLSEKITDSTSLTNLARLYHARWPDCLQITLLLAKCLMENGNEDEAVNLLHYCAANDTTAQVPTRLWGTNFQYKPLYPGRQEIVLNFAIPSDVAIKLGMNQLSVGPAVNECEEKQTIRTDVRSFDGYKVVPSLEDVYPQHPKIEARENKPKSKTYSEVEEELKRVAEQIKQPSIAKTDNRFPTYVILSMKKGLQNKYGESSTDVLIDEINSLALSIRKKSGWSSIIFFPDDLETCGKYGITPIDSIDPWKIKLSLTDLDKAIEKNGLRIGSVLIVGGDEIIPFHKLPNPTDDSDEEVRSDNPYSSLDTNYFVSDWPVGRLPGESGEDPGALLSQLRNVIEYHSDFKSSKNIINQIRSILFFWNRPWLKNLGNIGYSAYVWRQSTQTAFKPIGETKNLFFSPKGKQKAFDPKKLAAASIGYFNLHGVEDGCEWYGQKDSQEDSLGPDYPVAFKPSDLIKDTGNPRIVFSEACYGGHILDKTEPESIALSMLGIGVLAMIGSTTIAYGSVSTPLIGADLLGYLVMKNLTDGLTIGSAFSQAKVEFVREMNKRQGYLDGEDQKTLISFVLYGDPLIAYEPYQANAKTLGRQFTPPVVKTICDRTSFDEKNDVLAPKMISQAKSLVKDYLPGIEYAEVKINDQKIRLENSISTGSKANNSKQSNRVVVSFSKQIQQAEKTHKQFAKVTFDRQGKVIKLAISR